MMLITTANSFCILEVWIFLYMEYNIAWSHFYDEQSGSTTSVHIILPKHIFQCFHLDASLRSWYCFPFKAITFITGLCHTWFIQLNSIATKNVLCTESSLYTFMGLRRQGGACTYDRSVTSCTTRRAGRTLHGTRSVRGARTPKCI